MTPEARTALRELMGSDDVATMALYLDEHKERLDQQIPGSREWHYDDIPVCDPKPYAEYCPNGHCASTQIERHRRVLADSHEPKLRKQFAVFVLTHLIGDIHQPLHSADNDDRGGNGIKVRLPDGRKPNLHAAWDTAPFEGLVRGRHDVAVAKDLIEKYAGGAAAWQQARAATGSGRPTSSHGRWPTPSCPAFAVASVLNQVLGD